jgi:hypothetical protein
MELHSRHERVPTKLLLILDGMQPAAPAQSNARGNGLCQVE